MLNAVRPGPKPAQLIEVATLVQTTEPFEPVRSRSASSVVQRQIVERIRSGRLREGDTLPGERVLASQMDVSRPTIRQAVERLVAAGVLVNGKGRSGNLQVNSIWVPDDIDQVIEQAPDADEIFGLLEARRTVEPRLAQLAAARATAKHFDLLETSIELLRSHQHDISRAAQAESLFHRTIWQAAGNPALERMMIDLHDRLEVVHDSMLRTPADYASGIELHERTLEMLKRGEPKEIEAEFLKHLSHFESIVEDVLKRKSVRTLPAFIAS